MGLCCPCVSLTGGVYFAASSHICIGLFMNGYLVYSYLLSLATNGHGDYSFFLIFLLYAILLLILGCFIFGGIERKSVGILQPAAITFGALHGLIFLRVIYVILSKIIFSLSSSVSDNPSTKNELSSDTFGIVFFTFLFFATVIYLAILTIYIRELKMSRNNIFSQVQLGVGNPECGDANPLYAYNTVLCQP